MILVVINGIFPLGCAALTLICLSLPCPRNTTQAVGSKPLGRRQEAEARRLLPDTREAGQEALDPTWSRRARGGREATVSPHSPQEGGELWGGGSVGATQTGRASRLGALAGALIQRGASAKKDLVVLSTSTGLVSLSSGDDVVSRSC